mmetsp:Transcript_32513/g.75755  ORF Transcript_32513/g.75755 Transcript_32513/m.75755 type:complete len:381 (-) Transcript_32513:841-1983(-)
MPQGAGLEVAARVALAVRVRGAGRVLVLARPANGAVPTRPRRELPAPLQPLVVPAVLTELALAPVQIHAATPELAVGALLARLALAVAQGRLLHAAPLPHLPRVAALALLARPLREPPARCPKATLLTGLAGLTLPLEARTALSKGSRVAGGEALARGAGAILRRCAGLDLVFARAAHGTLGARAPAAPLAPRPVVVAGALGTLLAGPLAAQPATGPVGALVALGEGVARRARALLRPLALAVLILALGALCARLARALLHAPATDKEGLRRALLALCALPLAEVDTPFAVLAALARAAVLTLAAAHGGVGGPAPLAHLPRGAPGALVARPRRQASAPDAEAPLPTCLARMALPLVAQAAFTERPELALPQGGARRAHSV